MQATDMFVIGGGPAGLATAIAARRKGLQVILADGAKPPIDKACGEGLMPDGLSILRSLGVTVTARDAQPFRGIRFVNAGVSVAAAFQEGYALGLRRTVLHSKMIDAARAAGVQMLWNTPVSGICPEGVALEGRTVPARWIVRRWLPLACQGLGRALCMLAQAATVRISDSLSRGALG
jgi:2-polyprenyl-6-methoxyphenol hydroxylase-like FAD-dependent oxidoreductase